MSTEPPAHPPIPDPEPDEPVHAKSPSRTLSGDPRTRAAEIRQIIDAAIVILVCAAVFTGRLGPYWLALPAVVIVVNLLARRVDSRSTDFQKQFEKPGDRRVVLQVPGDRPVLVIREIRRIMGVDLMTAKQLVDEAPVVLLESVDHEAAAQAVYLLQKAGARAVMHHADPEIT